MVVGRRLLYPALCHAAGSQLAHWIRCLRLPGALLPVVSQCESHDFQLLYDRIRPLRVFERCLATRLYVDQTRTWVDPDRMYDSDSLEPGDYRWMGSDVRIRQGWALGALVITALITASAVFFMPLWREI